MPKIILGSDKIVDIRPGCVLKYRDFSYQVMDGLDMTGCDFTGSIFLHTSLQGANFTDAKMHNVFMSYACLRGSILVGADLADSEFRRADVRDCDFTSAKLRRCDFGRAKMSGVKLKGANVASLSLYENDWTGIDLSGVDLYHTYLGGVRRSEKDGGVRGYILVDGLLKLDPDYEGNATAMFRPWAP